MWRKLTETLNLELSLLLINTKEELEDRELSLEELSQLSGGVGLVDAMVSSTILMIVVINSLNVFGHTVNTLSKSKLRDSLNVEIHRDLEYIRDEVSNWARDETTWMTAYEPNVNDCENGTLAEALLYDSEVVLEEGTKQISSSITRTIQVDPNNSNLINISYKTSDGSLIKIESGTTLGIPAQGWCP